jgi:hypothetical protein
MNVTGTRMQWRDARVRWLSLEQISNKAERYIIHTISEPMLVRNAPASALQRLAMLRVTYQPPAILCTFADDDILN